MKICLAARKLFSMASNQKLRVGNIVHLDIAGGLYGVIIKIDGPWATVITITHHPGRHGGRFQIPNSTRLGIASRGPSYFWSWPERYLLARISSSYGYIDEPQAKELVKSADLDHETGYEFIRAVLQLAA